MNNNTLTINRSKKRRKRSSSIANLILSTTTSIEKETRIQNNNIMLQYLWSVFTYYSMWRSHRDDPDRMTLKSSLKFYEDCFQRMSNVLSEIETNSKDFKHPWNKQNRRTKKERERHEIREVACEAMSKRHAEILIHVTSRGVRRDDSLRKNVKISRGGVGGTTQNCRGILLFNQTIHIQPYLTGTQNLMFNGFLRLIASLAEPCRSNVR